MELPLEQFAPASGGFPGLAAGACATHDACHGVALMRGSMCCTMYLMATRMRSEIVRRASLPLTAQDDLGLATVRDSAAYHRALAALTGSDIDPSRASEATSIHAIFTVGLSALRDEVERQGYAQMAQERQLEATERRTLAHRRPPSWAAEA